MNDEALRECDYVIFSMLDYITPNESELMKLCGKEGDSVEDYVEWARQLLEKGVRNVLATLGKKGALFVSKEMEESLTKL
ncbi:MAG: hypothetical protein HFI44_14720 [Lachnospiraceae bacterium]|jgi:ribokinase|nr:hypothetical protein [Lachnospiraceae bacterium]GFI03221.1 ribokinase [Lachnospiraceae bacterium]